MASNNNKSRVAAEIMSGGTRHDATFFASYGMSNRFICARTGLRPGQVSYALKKAAVRISDYRNGVGSIARIVMKVTQKQVDSELYRHLRKTLSD
jgi:hypothetical protein